MFCSGDLIRIPSNVQVWKKDPLRVVKDFMLTKIPKIAIFIEYSNDGSCIINTDGEEWSVEVNHIRMMDYRDDKISTNKEKQLWSI